ncbi:MAG: glycogen/starch synthase [Myxococcota bacterium]|nr:glycogen/starch synthase [Myxococcota bacterium]MDW8361724.1 glycogen/starch synthase [Myxococcales bacterium]
MEILFISDAVAPFGTGWAAEAAACLGKALRSSGHRVTVVCPLPPGIDPVRRSLSRRLTRLEGQGDGGRVSFDVYEGRTPGGVETVLLGAQGHSCDVASEPSMGAAFADAVVRLVKQRTAAPDIVHAEGRAGAAALVAFDSDEAPAAPRILVVRPGDADDERTARALAVADALVVPSPTVARRLREEDSEQGPLAAFVREGRGPVVGILDGLDAAVWNPMTDPLLPARFDAFDRAGKSTCRIELQRRLELPLRADIPLVAALVGAADGGWQLLEATAPRILRNELELVLLLDGPPDDPRFERLRAVAARYSERCAAVGASAELLHRAIAAADVVLCPPAGAPGTSLHLSACRYGALPVVRRTPWTADALVDCDPALETGDAFFFDRVDEEEWLATVRRAVAAFHRGARFEARRTHVMRRDHSWDRAARQYEALYRRLTAG